MQIISNIALISINETLIIQMVSFLIFMFIMNIVMFRPLNRVMKKRKEYMEGLKQDATDSDLGVANLMEQMEKHESAARQEAKVLKKELEESEVTLFNFKENNTILKTSTTFESKQKTLSGLPV